MAKQSLFSLGLVTVLLSLCLRTVLSDVTLDQLFIVHSGGSNGGCDGYFDQTTKKGPLDDWLDEINFSLTTAIDRLAKYDDNDNDGVMVRRAVQIYFGIRNQGKARGNAKTALDNIIQNLKYVHSFFNLDLNEFGVPFYPLNGNRYLFCDSDFVVEQAEDTPARDWQANVIHDAEGNEATIANVYAEALASGKAWWSGDYTPVNGYYFSSVGGEYCENHVGLAFTADIKINVNGNPDKITSVVLCGSSLTADKPASYKAGDAMIVEGKNLADVVPRSATLFHEAFHVVFGGEFLDKDEDYPLVVCINNARVNRERAMINPENYVFLVAHLYYLFGEPDGDEGTSIDKNWNFEVTGSGKNRILGATEPL